MSRTARAAIAAATLPTSLACAEIAQVDWWSERPLLTPDEPTTLLRMSVTWDDRMHDGVWGVFADSLFDVVSIGGAGGVIGARNYSGNVLANSDGDVQPDGGITGIWIFGLPSAFGGEVPPPLEVEFTYTATDFTARDVTYGSEFEFFRIYCDRFGGCLEPLDTVVTPVTFSVVPAPAGVLCCVVAVAAPRRRR